MALSKRIFRLMAAANVNAAGVSRAKGGSGSALIGTRLRVQRSIFGDEPPKLSNMSALRGPAPAVRRSCGLVSPMYFGVEATFIGHGTLREYRSSPCISYARPSTAIG
jgi:hypothetical protein